MLTASSASAGTLNVTGSLNALSPAGMTSLVLPSKRSWRSDDTSIEEPDRRRATWTRGREHQAEAHLNDSGPAPRVPRSGSVPGNRRCATTSVGHQPHATSSNIVHSPHGEMERRQRVGKSDSIHGAHFTPAFCNMWMRRSGKSPAHPSCTGSTTPIMILPAHFYAVLVHNGKRHWLG